MKKITHQQALEIGTSLGFRTDLDNFNTVGKNWIRFELSKDLDEQDLRWIWYKNESFEANMAEGARILFQGGQKALREKAKKLFTEFVNID